MRRWLPYPGLALALLLVWLLLSQSVSVGQLLLGSGAALVGTRTMAVLRPPRSRRVRLAPLMKLAGLVAVDVVRSNLAVAAIILFPRKGRVSGFVRIPLELTERGGLALLGLILTATPGTLWVEYDQRRRTLLLHVLDLIDEEEWANLIKSRYETLLLQAFEQ
ncbi:Na+/H+ antiporter subunit E [Sphingomonas desiccabilis]|uniref:Na+/H+ antiporter subunit E n=1 Tax=Sphingomonas desiccabilis TaxID=429134 RepID=A0A4Q2J1I8_9SPHN|nr:Na+/H+ antiporter subunit E [Sphingomonas desiccabilis]MBB3912733.1 multicomponent K+:H+ antiporter subunit E [Sphingomonas desiccabilis]RXZ35560.1 Na+/H+ antiporter subunit E [Sphingomonas desiccabilis]